jgi:hypothetical protein
MFGLISARYERASLIVTSTGLRQPRLRLWGLGVNLQPAKEGQDSTDLDKSSLNTNFLEH